VQSSSHPASARPSSAVLRATVRKRISPERAIALSILLISFPLRHRWLAYAYWHAKESLHTAIALNFRELARQGVNENPILPPLVKRSMAGGVQSPQAGVGGCVEAILPSLSPCRVMTIASSLVLQSISYIHFQLCVCRAANE
jgi:hypothetical protein